MFITSSSHAPGVASGGFQSSAIIGSSPSLAATSFFFLPRPLFFSVDVSVFGFFADLSGVLIESDFAMLIRPRFLPSFLGGLGSPPMDCQYSCRSSLAPLELTLVKCLMLGCSDRKSELNGFEIAYARFSLSSQVKSCFFS